MGGLLVIVGVAGELWIGFRSSKVETDLREETGKTISETNERAAQAEQAAESLKQQNLILESELLKLRKAAEPRRLTGQQKATLARLLRAHGPDGVVVVSAMMDPESGDLADDFDAAGVAAHGKH